jgi:phage terminase large subunit GpA-like protein
LFVAASQEGGKTEILLNACFHYIYADPSPQILVSYSVEMVEALSKHRVAPNVMACPELRSRVAEAKSRDSGNTIRDKQYPGGALTLVGANSAGGLSMHPKRVALFDEIDRYPSSAGTEGDPVALAKKRTTAYWNARHVYVTSPGVKEYSRSWRLWKQSDQREWFVRCPDCEAEQFLKWSQVAWQKDENGEHLPKTAVYGCEACGSVWDDATRWRVTAAGFYRATGDFQGLAGFRISALATGNRTLASIVKEWLDAQGNPEELKVFKNTVLAEWWEDVYETLDESGLMARRETFEMVGDRPLVPAPCPLITAGFDFQENRGEITVDAWTTGEECYRLAHVVVWGDPSSAAFWDDMDAFLLSPWKRALGGVDFIRGACLDTGSNTQAVYDFCGPRFRRPTPDGGRQFVFAIKGQSGQGELWPRAASKASTKVPLWPIRVDVGKEQIYGRLAQTTRGPGYVHFPHFLDKRYFQGLTAEKVITRTDKKGFARRSWAKKTSGARNEPLDCAVYSYAALCGLRAQGFDLDLEVERIVHRRVFVPPETDAVQVGVATPPVAPRAPVRAKREPGWLGDTRGWI